MSTWPVDPDPLNDTDSSTPVDPDSAPAAGLNTPPENPAADRSAQRSESVRVAAAAWRKRLADLGGPNTLLWYRDLSVGTLDLSTAHPGGVSMLMAGRATRLSDLVREPKAFAEARARAHAIYAKTVELAEERGLQSGFLAIGMATWQLPNAPKARPQAPVLLRPCVLRPVGPAALDYDVDLGDEVELNPVLVAYLNGEANLDIDADVLADLAMMTRRFDPVPVFRELLRLCAQVPKFRITDRKVLSTFPHAKHAAVRDLATQVEQLAEHDLVAALAGDEEARREVRRAGEELLGDDVLVLDADAAQVGVVDAIRSGRNLLVESPPGTGATQTIANAVAALAADGRRVLVVSEKRAALTGMVRRLASVGLADLVLDAGPTPLDATAVARDVLVAAERAANTAPSAGPVSPAIDTFRRPLEAHREGMHQPRQPWGVSVSEAHDALARLGQLPQPPSCSVRLSGAALAGLDRARVRQLGQVLADVVSCGGWDGPAANDPWFGAQVADREHADYAEQLVGLLAAGALREQRIFLDGVLTGAGLPAATTAADWAVGLDLLEAVRDTLSIFEPKVLETPLDELVAATGDQTYRERHGDSVPWYRRVSLRRAAKELVRPGAYVPDLHAALALAQEQREQWRLLAGEQATPRLSTLLAEGRRRWSDLSAELEWLSWVWQTTPAGGQLVDLPLDQLERRVTTAAQRVDRLRVLPQVVPLRAGLAEAGLDPVVVDLAARAVPLDQVGPELDFVWWSSILADVAATDSGYGEHDGQHLRDLAADFVAADRAGGQAGAAWLRSRARTRLAATASEYPEQVGALRRLTERRRGCSATSLLTLAPDLVHAAKPCWVMSPLVVAATVPPGTWFDVVIIDQAGQLPVAHAISAISRANQIVVVGDSHQVPPSGFFTSAVDDEVIPASDDVVRTGIEPSLLDAVNGWLPTRRLEWHYTSRDERLIAFSNAHLYDRRLVTFPGVAATSPVTLVGAASVARESSSDPEVTRVVRLVLDHALHHPQQSLGVVTFGLRQTRKIEAALRASLTASPSAELAEFFAGDRPERFYIKHVDWAAGDTRDAIIVSVGHDPGEHGEGLRRLGPLSLDGGERRLNVAITLSRSALTVVSALTEDDLDPRRLAGRGAVLLREFLRYATTGADQRASQFERTAGEDAEITDPILADLVQGLRADGLVVHERYGSSRLPIDIVVEDPTHPGRLCVAVESDGRVYADIGATRDRERLRPDHLRALGWNYVRVWGTDLARYPSGERQRVREAVALAGTQRAGSTPASRSAF